MFRRSRPARWLRRAAVLAVGAALVAGCGAGPAPAGPSPVVTATRPATASALPVLTPTTARPTPSAIPTAGPPSTTPLPAPTSQPTDTSTPLPAVRAALGGAAFDVPAGLARGVAGQALAGAGAPGEAGLPPWVVFPTRLEFELTGYVRGEAYHTPRLIIYPVADFERLNPAAADVIAETRQVLARRPAIPAQSHLLPFINAGQTLRAQFAFLDFEGGAGFRFVTHYTQGLIPISSRELFYAFQGLTTDGAYYVAAVLPIGAVILPDTYAAAPPAGGPLPPGYDQADFETAWPRYLQEVAQALEALPAGGYTPTLAALDGMLSSLSVAAPPAEPCAAAWPSALTSDQRAYVSLDPPVSNRLRAAPAVAASLVGGLPAGTVVDLLAGPVCADAVLWWQVAVRTGPLAGQNGWTAEGSEAEQWLRACPAAGTCPP